MKGSVEYGRRLDSLLKKIRSNHRSEPYEEEDPIGELIYSFLHWNAPRRSADTAMAKITRQTVDYNDLRVSHTHEIVAILGERYPAAHERVARMRETLQEVFNREHILSLDKLSGRSKKEIRLYLEELPGMAPFVAAHMALVVFSGHAVPVDDRLGELLQAEGAVNPEFTVAQMTGFLERHVRADSAAETHAALTAWADAGTQRATMVRTTKRSTRTGTGRGAKKKRTSKSKA